MGQNAKHTVGLFGHGLLCQLMKHHLDGTYQTVHVSLDSSQEQMASCQLIVYCSDRWSPKTLQVVNRRCRRSGVALLPVYTEWDEAMIGPCVMPQEAGCTSCAELRKLAAASKREERHLIRQYLFGERELVVPQPWLTSFSQEVLVQLAAAEIGTYFQRPTQMQTRQALLCIALETLDCRRHRFLPHAHCPDCATPAPDTAELAIIVLQACPKLELFTYRTRHITADAEQLFTQYVDARAGLIQSFQLPEEKSAFPLALARLNTELPDGGLASPGTGCSGRTEHSQVVALLEALERYAGERPRGKQTKVVASYQQLGSRALDPTTLGLYGPEQYAQPRFRFVPYHPDLVCHWVWGYSFQRQAPILVPERCAYYALPHAGAANNPAFVDETSNGCALGTCLEEAIFHGILEVVERDAFLLTWYAQLNIPQLDPRSVIDPSIRVLIEHVEYQTGYRLHVFDATLDHAIPCLWIIGIDEQDRKGYPKAHCVAGSHPHPEQALSRGLRELATGLAIAPQRYEQGKARALKMLADPSRVELMADHSLLYYLPEAFGRLGFLFGAQKQESFQQAFRAVYAEPLAHADLRDDLNALINHYLALGIDVIVVDQAVPEYAPYGFRCVKVLMPGMLPMTFGQPYRRVTGLPRLYDLPHRLGYSRQPLTEGELNPHPHPFF